MRSLSCVPEEPPAPNVGPRALLALVDTIHHKPTGVCVEAERAFLVAIEGGCSVPAACHARWVDGLIVADAMWADDGDPVPRRLQLSADPLHVHALGTELARRLRHG